MVDFSTITLFRGLLGLTSLLLISFLFSNNRKKIQWKTVFISIFIQFIVAVLILKNSLIQSIFEIISKFFVRIINYTTSGSSFLFSSLVDQQKFAYIFAFQVLPVIIFFSALTSVLYHLGIIQKIVSLLAWILNKFLKITGSESLSLAGNIFLGQTESPILIKSYLDKMTKSQLFLVMVGGMSTVAGSVLAAYIGLLGGNDLNEQLKFSNHLLTASVMAAPGAVAISKILFPEETESKIKEIKIETKNKKGNLLLSITKGTVEGVKLAVNVGAMLLVFLAFIALLNDIMWLIGESLNFNALISESTSFDQFSIEFVLGYLFAPLMWLIGVSYQECAIMGQLLGVKIVSSEFVAFIQLADLKNINNSIELLSKKSITMATFMLCGFANLTSIGIQIGGIGVLAPSQRKNLSELGFKAMIAGTIVSLISACFAGVLIS
ncbi:MAG: Na+ dependent nucleoside transporter [Flavobacteriales bacterium]|nr:MAG: Na+ dependent nucleoside transporter [Flavobacteriales bacterium TMED96]RPG56669.1 MAG: Na+ dependent nucleoside transporter [Flavobacteriales bacterium TMED96]RZP10418.1 MAG: Na+ dependent nucleoside transporter [Flavobacteriales bacterium]|tara:strand:+ start:628 stop:1935 length:1308 start_codon:yes stop_codon:yes gene_type:complete